MISIMSYVSKDFIMKNKVPPVFAKLMAQYAQGANVLVGSKMYMQDFGGIPFENNKTFVLSRKKKFAGAKAISKPEDFKDGLVLGGRSTIASMLPYTNVVILGVEKENAIYGTKFPSLKGFEISDTIEDADFTLRIYRRKQK